MSAGLLEVKGPGIIITLDYTPLEEDMGFDPSLIYPEYLLLLLNELNSSGAEAIAINEQRIISTSEIRLLEIILLLMEKSFLDPSYLKLLRCQNITIRYRIKGWYCRIIKFKLYTGDNRE